MKVYLYCTKGKPYLNKIFAYNDFDMCGGDMYALFSKKHNAQKDIQYVPDFEEYGFINLHNKEDIDELKILSDVLNGKIVGCFDLNRVEKFTPKYNHDLADLEKLSCLSRQQMQEYAKGKDFLYAWHIDNLQVFDETINLEEFATIGFRNTSFEKFIAIEKAPQSWQYAYWVNGENPSEKVVILSIQPQWLCKILNKEKTIEIRKSYPKENR